MSYEAALRRVLGVEGVYSNDPTDRGGETFCGISRVNWPSWPGWAIIDQQKQINVKPSLDVQGLREAVSAFYLQQFWTPLCCHLIQDEFVAYELFEAAVNLGVGKSGMLLQEALNLLNRNGASWPEVGMDGRVGPTTLAVVGKALAEPNGGRTLVTLLNHLQAEHYITLARRSPTQERFLRGWLTRT